MGEIRLQWWRDALVLPPQLRTGHPVADAVRKAAQDRQLPADLLEALIDARSLLLHDPSPLTDEALRNLLWKTEGTLFALGAHVVGLPASSGLHASCAAAGQAYGLVRLLLDLPRMLAAGRVPLAKAQLELSRLVRRGTAHECFRFQDGDVARRLFCPNSPQFGRGAAVRGHLAADGARRLPSFGLGRALSAGSRAVGRCAAAQGNACCAPYPSLQDCCCPSVWPTVRRGAVWALEGKKGTWGWVWWRSGDTLWRGCF